jgi:hypothetical protein
MWEVFMGWGSGISLGEAAGFGPLAQEVNPIASTKAVRRRRVLLSIRAPILLGIRGK